MLNYTKYNCGLPSGPRRIAVSWLALSVCAGQCVILIADARLKCISLHMSGRQADKPGDVTAQHSSVMYSSSNPMCYYTSARNFAVQINGFMSLTSYFDVKYRY